MKDLSYASRQPIDRPDVERECLVSRDATGIMLAYNSPAWQKVFFREETTEYLAAFTIEFTEVAGILDAQWRASLAVSNGEEFTAIPPTHRTDSFEDAYNEVMRAIVRHHNDQIDMGRSRKEMIDAAMDWYEERSTS